MAGTADGQINLDFFGTIFTIVNEELPYVEFLFAKCFESQWRFEICKTGTSNFPVKRDKAY